MALGFLATALTGRKSNQALRLQPTEFICAGLFLFSGSLNLELLAPGIGVSVFSFRRLLFNHDLFTPFFSTTHSHSRYVEYAAGGNDLIYDSGHEDWCSGRREEFLVQPARSYSSCRARAARSSCTRATTWPGHGVFGFAGSADAEASVRYTNTIPL